MCACRATWGLKGSSVPDLSPPSYHYSGTAGANIFPWAAVGCRGLPWAAVGCRGLPWDRPPPQDPAKKPLWLATS